MRTLAVFAFCASVLLADGPGVIALQTAGPWRVTVIASPFPLRTGPVTIGVLVQSPATMETIANARVKMIARSAGGRQMTLRADGRRFLWSPPAAGVWELESSIEDDGASAQFTARVNVGDAAGPFGSYIGWIAAVPVGIGLFAINRALNQRKSN